MWLDNGKMLRKVFPAATLLPFSSEALTDQPGNRNFKVLLNTHAAFINYSWLKFSLHFEGHNFICLCVNRGALHPHSTNCSYYRVPPEPCLVRGKELMQTGHSVLVCKVSISHLTPICSKQRYKNHPGFSCYLLGFQKQQTERQSVELYNKNCFKLSWTWLQHLFINYLSKEIYLYICKNITGKSKECE